MRASRRRRSTPLCRVSPALPLGLSFYVFTAIGYCADVAAGKVDSEKNPIRFAVFLAFFGHGPSGPIVRYGQQAPQLDPGSETRRVSADRFCYGIKRLVLGLAKKAIIADQLALIYAKVASVPAATLPAPILVLGYTAYMMQLYFDFSGYSDMAIGIGEFFGITLPENFEYPYLACSVGEYWRRWHISLSSWFRDYVYIPLGGSRVAAKRRLYFNIFIVWLLTGIWHGAKWTYIVWGMMYFVLLCVERILNLSGQKSWLGWIYTVFFFIAGNVVFRSENVTGALKYLLAMFNIHTTGLLDEKAVYYFAEYKMFLLIGMAAALPIAVWLRAQSGRRGAWIERLRPVWCVAVFLVALSFIVKGGYNPFIYFDF